MTNSAISSGNGNSHATGQSDQQHSKTATELPQIPVAAGGSAARALTASGPLHYFARVPQANTVTIDSHAAATLRYIRASMEAAGTLAIPPSAAITVGVFGLGAAVLGAALPAEWLMVWLSAALLAGAAGGYLLIRRSALQGFALLGAPLRKFLLCLLPNLFVGGVLTLLLYRAGLLQAIPGTWLLCYGSALMSTSALTGRAMALLGALFGLLGLAALALPDSLQNALLGGGFGALHIMFGVLVNRERHG